MNEHQTVYLPDSVILSKLESIHTLVTELGTKMEAIVGNGQPGRMQVAEAEIKEHSETLSKLKGALILLGFMITAIGGAEAFSHFGKH